MDAAGGICPGLIKYPEDAYEQTCDSDGVPPDSDAGGLRLDTDHHREGGAQTD
jgi:hypothetical protein